MVRTVAADERVPRAEPRGDRERAVARVASVGTGVLGSRVLDAAGVNGERDREDDERAEQRLRKAADHDVRDEEEQRQTI